MDRHPLTKKHCKGNNHYDETKFDLYSNRKTRTKRRNDHNSNHTIKSTSNAAQVQKDTSRIFLITKNIQKTWCIVRKAQGD